jgi:translation initiation factor 4E
MDDDDEFEFLDEHPLKDTWTLWMHRPQDTNWSSSSYIKVMTVETVEELFSLTNQLNDVFIKNTLLFLMKNDIRPEWEDPKNCNGGSFSFKVKNEHVSSVWHQLSYGVGGGFVSANPAFVDMITGITLSPKKGSCIVKIWMENSTFQNVNLIQQDIVGLEKQFPGKLRIKRPYLSADKLREALRPRIDSLKKLSVDDFVTKCKIENGKMLEELGKKDNKMADIIDDAQEA